MPVPRIAIALLLLAVAGAVHAQATELRRCIGPKGQVSYTQAPCPPGWRLHHSIYTAPEPAPSNDEVLRRALARRKADADSRYLQGLAGTAPGAQGHRVGIARDTSACDAAKADRERVLAQVGLSRGIDLMRSLDDRVFDACR